MPVHRLRFYLRLVLACFALAIAEILAWGVLAPKSEIAGAIDTKQESSAVIQGRDLPPLRDFARFWARPLRQPLYNDPTAQAATTPPPARNTRQAITFKLLGTIMDGEQSTAIVGDRFGKQELKRAGERLGAEETGPTIVEIAEKQIVVDNRGQRVTLALEEPVSIEELLNAEPATGPG